jgi:hypothetical protein
MENKAHSYLLDWTINFLKNKDLMLKKIESIEKGKDGFDLYIKYKDKEQYVLVIPTISDLSGIIQKFSNTSYFTIVTLNSKENLDEVLKSWAKLVDFRFLNIIFTNPFSSGDKRWIIYPSTHNKVSEQSSLKLGLKSMFEMVDSIDEQKLVSKIKD